MSFYPQKNGRTIINICSTIYIFKQNSSSVDNIVKFFHLSEGTKDFLTISKPGEAIMALNGSVTAIKFEVTNFEKDFVFT